MAFFFRPIADMVESDQMIVLRMFISNLAISMTTIIITADVKAARKRWPLSIN